MIVHRRHNVRTPIGEKDRGRRGISSGIPGIPPNPSRMRHRRQEKRRLETGADDGGKTMEHSTLGWATVDFVFNDKVVSGR